MKTAVRSAPLSPECNWEKWLTKSLPRDQPIVPRIRSGPVDVSFGQQRLWFLAQLESGSATYNTPIAWRIAGPLNLSALQRSLSQLVTRHEALRTTFAVVDEYPRQIINEALPVSIATNDLRTIERCQRESEIKRRIREEAQRAFNLSVEPMVRAALFRVEDHEHVFVLTLHHIVCDGPSIAILLQELALFYGGFLSGKPVHIPELPVQYADFAVWQREIVDEIRDEQLAYWKEQLRSCPAALDFPSERVHPIHANFRGEMEYRNLSRQLSADFQSLARRHDVTDFMALVALFQVLLSRYTGQEDICVGSPVTHRTRAEVSRVLGFFSNMVVLRGRLDGNPTFREFLHKVRDTVLSAYAHQDLPFEQLVAELQPERVPGRNPFFQAMLEVEEPAWRHLEIPGAQCTLLPVHNGTSKFDFSLGVVDHPEGFRLGLEFNADLSDAETARGLLENYENLLQGAVNDPDCAVFNLPLLSSRKREELLLKWNNSRQDYPDANCTHRLFEAQVQKAPNAVAVKFQAQRLTYQELNSRANQLARYLVSLGVGAEVLVAVCLERSLDLVIALLAVMKSGAAYLPLDPSHPAERRKAILQDSGARMLITCRAVSQDLHAIGACTVVLFKDVNTSSQSAANLPSMIRPNDLAYVIYTSGSTGRPNGVEVEHGNLANFLLTMRERPGLSRRDVLLAVTTVTFDIAGLELWLPLTVGASVIIASRDQVMDAHELLNVLEESKVTAMQATPATWRMLLAAGWRGNPRLKVLCGGESLSGSLADELVARCGSVWNMYGPTETTIWSSVHAVKAEEGPVVPIGYPIGNTMMYVLGRNMEPVPVGVRGELYIGGAGVARGYRGAQQLTAQRFVANPFSIGADSRLYRTGDLVRQRRDGNIEFLGRNDFQVKVRGFRIEPAEVEAVLARHPAVSEAVVQAREDVPGDKRLVAYVVAKNEMAHDLVSQLRSFMQTTLPDYMVPSAFVVLDALPKTPSGKLHWQALPVPEHRAQEVALIVPQDAIETRLARIWEELLDIHPVGVTDNFFELGGDSLLGTHLFARVEEEFAKQLPMGTLFEAPTIQKLAAILRQDSWVPSALIQVQAGDPSVPPVFFVQARVGYRALAAELGAHQPFYVVPYDDLFVSETERGLGTLAEELAQRIREHHPHGPYYLGGWCLAGHVAFAVAREICRQGEEVALLAIIEMSAPGYAEPCRRPTLRSFTYPLLWHLRYVLHGSRQQKIDWIAGSFRALGWQARYRAWQLARLFFRRIGRSLPRSLRDATRLMEEAADKDAPTSYPGRITLFRSSERTFTREEQWDLGWGRIAAHGVDVYEIPGLKGALLRANVTEVGVRLKECLTRAYESRLGKDMGDSLNSACSAGAPPTSTLGTLENSKTTFRSSAH
jgi:amino acid adenylation domain-containing protein